MALGMGMGFAIGAVAVSWLVFVDPEVRAMYRKKNERLQEGGWRGLATEVARTTVLELRSAFPDVFRALKDGDA